MALVDKIPQNEKDMIEAYITENAFMGDNRKSERRVGVDSILHEWDRTKSEALYQLLGNQLIASKPITYDKADDELNDEIYEQLLTWRNRFYEEYMKKVPSKDETEYYSTLGKLLAARNLRDNIYHSSSFQWKLPDGSILKVNQGCKLMRVLSKIANAYNLEGFEEFRLAHSRILNDKSLHGNLYLSIHPLDYMTMSDNDCRWSSCMSWIEGGDYRGGTVEMMNSPCVVVAYLDSSHDFEIGEGEWNSKKWRELFIVNENVITGIKAYPYPNQDLENVILDWLHELATKNLGWEYFDEKILVTPRESFFVDDREMSIVYKTRVMYNDFRRAEYPTYISKTIPEGENKIVYSGIQTCMCCGEIMVYNDNEPEDLVCCECEHTRSCYECGERENISDMIEANGHYYCRYCYERDFYYCEHCDSNYYYDNGYSVHLAVVKDDKIVITHYEESMCEDCYENLKCRGLIHGYEDKENGWEYYYYILLNEANSDILTSYFGVDKDLKIEDNEIIACVKDPS